MNTITLELTEETARQMLPILEQRQGVLAANLNAINSQITRIKSFLGVGLFSASERQKAPELVLPMPRPTKTAHGRIKKGESAKLIMAFLASANGNGATLKEITTGTGTSYGTARRIVIGLANDQKAVHRGEKWFIANDFAA